MLKDIRLEELVASATNPRKTFDPVKLDELASSIASKGVLEPLLVRPYETFGPAKYEIVAGERRFRAATLAGVETAPCIVRDLTDVEALEVQTVENLQRDDLHPLEEAEGYAALMKFAGYDVAQIAQRIGKGEGYVYDRLKLLQLIPAIRTVFLGGEISVGHAIPLARLNAADQKRALKGGGYGFGSGVNGLFQMDVGGAQQPGLDLDDRRRRKAVSVRELQEWINDQVRFRPEEVDLPNLFPETAAALETAQEQQLKVVKITRDYQLKPETRGTGERTYSRRSWKRADGKPDGESWEKPKPSRACDHSVLGVVVAGPGRGEAFPVCIAKKKCTVHWGEEQKAANQRGAPNGAGTSTGKGSWEEDDRRREEKWKKKREEDDRWKKAGPALQEALAEKLKAVAPLELVDIVLDECRPHGMPKLPKQMDAPETPEDALRLAAFFCLTSTITNSWSASTEVPKALKKYGIDAKKIVDQVAPKPKAQKKKKKAPAKKKAKAKKASA